MMMKKLCAAALLAVVTAGPALALTGDREQPIQITAHSFSGDEVKQTATYTGSVVVHQGTLEILGDRLNLTVSPEGYRTLTVTGNPVRLKEKRDNPNAKIDEWMHASGAKLVYEEKSDAVTLTTNAKLARSENGIVRDSSQGDTIVYDLRTARSTVKSAVVDGKRTRVTTVLAPRPKAAKNGTQK